MHFLLVKHDRFLSESSRRCLDEPWGNAIPPGGWWWGLCWGRLGFATGVANGGNHKGFQGPLKMSERVKKSPKMVIFQQKNDDLLGERDLVVVLMCMFRVEL